jgi:hypothetical protein
MGCLLHEEHRRLVGRLLHLVVKTFEEMQEDLLLVEMDRAEMIVVEDPVDDEVIVGEAGAWMTEVEDAEIVEDRQTRLFSESFLQNAVRIIFSSVSSMLHCDEMNRRYPKLLMTIHCFIQPHGFI